MFNRTISSSRLLPNKHHTLTSNTVRCSTAVREVSIRTYARPAKLNIPTKAAFKAPPPPSPPAPVKQPPSIEDGHTLEDVPTAEGPFDQYLETTALDVFRSTAADLSRLYMQYRERAGRTLNLVIPYEERPARHRRADNITRSTSDDSGDDGLVMVVHVLMKDNGKVDKLCACSGFVVDARPINQDDTPTEVVITCAHTLEEIHRHIKTSDNHSGNSFSFIISSDGTTRQVKSVLSSMPKSDVIAIELSPAAEPGAKLLTSLPLSPFPVYNGSVVLTHLFGASEPPTITRSESRLPAAATTTAAAAAKNFPADTDSVQTPIPWLQENAWRRWAVGVMLGYRSYTGIEVEAGIHSSLPHMQTSILPTSGSSGGPLVCGDTGAVVGLISGRRMDNRVEGERGWGTSAESIFEMFSLPGFVPASKR